MIKEGDCIISLSDHRKLTVEQVLPIGFTSYNFSARYTTPAGIDVNGVKVYGNRGFRYKDKGIKWIKRVSK
jgi:hypothetical protein